uniref:COesterase domain-containing protein n=1 Tax=Steinernema glaseri TaxID=37863 RepID=A0A1I8AP17_9BILA
MFSTPSTKDAEWLRTDHRHPRRYLSFNVPKPVMKDNLMYDAFDFWARLSKDFDYDVVRGVFASTKKTKDEL